MRKNGGFADAKVTVTKIAEPEPVRGLLLVTFQPAASPPPAAKTERAPSKKQTGRLRELERELQFTRESLRSTVEELQSSNEELQSTNEELQSSNEELETSREEMQSLNEELQTVNAQLQGKVDALSQSNDDMQNLLNSTSVATHFPGLAPENQTVHGAGQDRHQSDSLGRGPAHRRPGVQAQLRGVRDGRGGRCCAH